MIFITKSSIFFDKKIAFIAKFNFFDIFIVYNSLISSKLNFQKFLNFILIFNYNHIFLSSFFLKKIFSLHFFNFLSSNSLVIFFKNFSDFFIFKANFISSDFFSNFFLVSFFYKKFFVSLDNIDFFSKNIKNLNFLYSIFFKFFIFLNFFSFNFYWIIVKNF